MSAGERFLHAAPPLQRAGLRLLIALGNRPRGVMLLARMPAAAQLAHATLSLLRYDDRRAAAALGWDPEAVVARGRTVRERRA